MYAFILIYITFFHAKFVYSDQNLNNFSFLHNLSEDVEQLVIVTQEVGVKAKLQTYSKTNRVWQLIKTYPAVIGEKGFADLGKKREGDNTTPSGLFNIIQAFGYSELIESKMPYRQATEIDKFIDDVNSKEYNTWVRGETLAKSFEKMLRKDDLYKYGLIIDYNMNPIVPGKGSAIFIHVWRNSAKGTAGCIALDIINLIELLKWLDPNKKPKIAINLN